jgi:hypothetical protein
MRGTAPAQIPGTKISVCQHNHYIERAAIVRYLSQCRGKVHLFVGETVPLRRKARRSPAPVGAPT